jgi:hypothetical protein
MRGGITNTENDIGNIDPAEQKALNLIRRFNDPEHEHILRGTFKDTDSLDEIRAKERQAETKISQALAELVALRTAVNRLKAGGARRFKGNG